MRKLILSAVATAMLTVTGASANSCDKEAVVKGFNNNKHKIGTLLKGANEANADYLRSESFFKSVSTKGLNISIGTVQNNTLNLQLPSGTIQQDSDWTSVFMKIRNYISFSPDEKEFYYRLSQYNYYILKNVVSKAPEIYNDITLQKGMTKDHAWTVLDVALSNRNTKDERQNALRSFIIFSLIADPTADDSFAKKYFSKHDEVLNCVKQAIGL